MQRLPDLPWPTDLFAASRRLPTRRAQASAPAAPASRNDGVTSARGERLAVLLQTLVPNWGSVQPAL